MLPHCSLLVSTLVVLLYLFIVPRRTSCYRCRPPRASYTEMRWEMYRRSRYEAAHIHVAYGWTFTVYDCVPYVLPLLLVCLRVYTCTYIRIYIPTGRSLSNLYRVEYCGPIDIYRETNKQNAFANEGDRQHPPYIVVALSFWFHVVRAKQSGPSLSPT